MINDDEIIEVQDARHWFFILWVSLLVANFFIFVHRESNLSKFFYYLFIFGIIFLYFSKGRMWTILGKKAITIKFGFIPISQVRFPFSNIAAVEVISAHRPFDLMAQDRQIGNWKNKFYSLKVSSTGRGVLVSFFRETKIQFGVKDKKVFIESRNPRQLCEKILNRASGLSSKEESLPPPPITP
jgi:hypothetical protein